MPENKCEFALDVLDERVLTEDDYQSVGLVGTIDLRGKVAWIDWARVETIYCDAPAPIRIAGETDSWGTEWIYVCRSCNRAGAFMD